MAISSSTGASASHGKPPGAVGAENALATAAEAPPLEGMGMAATGIGIATGMGMAAEVVATAMAPVR